MFWERLFLVKGRGDGRMRKEVSFFRKSFLLVIISLSFVLLVSSLVFAHQPKLGGEDITVIDPVVSKAYYGELTGVEHFYTIHSDEEFPIYINVLVPGDKLTHTISAELYSGEELIYFLDGENFEWEKWYEPYGMDYYMLGPEIGDHFKSTENLPAGDYGLKVFNENNQGKYSLAVGVEEEFPPLIILNSFFVVPWIKLNFFGDVNLLGILLLVFSLMTATFIYGYYKKDNSKVDVVWGLGFILIAYYSLFYNGVFTAMKLIATAFVTFWGLRLSYHIYRRNKGKKEDFRYAKWRKEWGKKVHFRAFFQVYMLQGLVMLIVALPIIVINSYSYTEFDFFSLLGIIVFLVGFLYESVADYQLKVHKAKSKKIMQSGLWKYSRHPNYFGESLIWIGFGLMAFSTAWWAMISPVLISYLLIKVSGIPMLEKKMKKNKEYQKYMKKTNAFIPSFK